MENDIKNELRNKTFVYTTNIYTYAAKLRAEGHPSLAEKLISSSLEAQYNSVFTGFAYEPSRFIDYLINGYHAACKVKEILDLINSMGIEKDDENKGLREGIDIIVRQYGASISTYKKKQFASQTPPMEQKKFEAPVDVEPRDALPIPMEEDQYIERITEPDNKSEDTSEE